MVVIAVRLISVFLALKKEPFSNREKIFIGFNMPKGIALATSALVLSTLHLYALNVVLQVLVMVMIYSIVLSYILDFKSHKMLGYQATSEHYKHDINVLEFNMPATRVANDTTSRKLSRKSKKKSLKKKVARKAPVKKASKKVVRKAKPKKSSKKRR